MNISESNKTDFHITFCGLCWILSNSTHILQNSSLYTNPPNLVTESELYLPIHTNFLIQTAFTKLSPKGEYRSLDERLT